MKFKLCLVFSIIILLNFVSCNENDNNLVVDTWNGKLQGKDNGYYYSYESIPYAEAPVDELRFEPPQKYERKWSNIRDATKKPEACMAWDQFKEGDYKLTGVEDCLFVNIYKPKTGKEKYPVLVYIHGGCFMFGSVNAYGEDLIMQSGNMILVKISYRLGPLGFLSTEDDAITGNFGLKDQQLALEWIKENIASFGGDPDKIMVLGFSAGGASTQLQMLKPSLKNIVKVAVSLSGVTFNPWVITKNPHKNALKLAKHLQCPDLKDTHEIKKCLKHQKPENIVETVKEFLNIGYNPFTTFGPVIEDTNAVNAFITQHPRDIIKSGHYAHIPWLASYTKEDGAYNAGELLQINPKIGTALLSLLNDKWSELATKNLFLQNIKEDPQEYAKQLRHHYLGNLTFSEENYLKVQQIYTDVLFKNGVYEAIRLHSQHTKAPVYGYVYDNPADLGVAHTLAQRLDVKFGG